MPGPYLFTDAKIQTSSNIQNVRLFFMLKSIVLLIYIKKKVLIWEYMKQDCNIKRQIQADNHSGSKQNVKNPFSLIIPVFITYMPVLSPPGSHFRQNIRNSENRK